MANGIKLRRGIKTALTTTIADGELVFATDSGELGFKNGSQEHFINLASLSTALNTINTVVKGLNTTVSDIQDDITVLQANEVKLLPGEFVVNVNKHYDYSLNDIRPSNNGGYRIPIAKVNPLFTSGEFEFSQVFNFTNSIVQAQVADSYGTTLNTYTLSRIGVYAEDDGYGNYTLGFNSGFSYSDFSLDILDDGYGNHTLWLKIPINSSATQKLSIKFTMYCISEIGEDINYNSYNVFLPPTGLEITPYNGAT